MTNGDLPADVKCTSVLRRVPSLAEARFRSECGDEGDVCAFELPIDAFPVTVEAPTGRVMAIVPGDVFLATPGHRQSTKWVDGKIPAGGLTPGGHYWVLAECGLVGELVGNSPSEKDHLGRVKYLGKVYGEGAGASTSGNSLCQVPRAQIATWRCIWYSEHLGTLARRPPGSPSCERCGCKAMRP